MHKSRLAAASIIAATALVASACGSSTSGSNSDASVKKLTIADAAEAPTYINPLNDNGATGLGVAQALFAPLVRTNPATGKVQNVIAQSVTPNSDSTVWTIKIKPGLQFDDGEPLTAQDYVASWNMTSQEARGWTNSGFFAKIKGWDKMNPLLPEGKKAPSNLPKKLSGLKVIDKTTFQATLSVPFSQFGLTLQYLGAAPMSAKERKDPDAYKLKPIGMGLYKVKGGVWKVGTDLDLVKSPTYKGPFAPQADEVVFKFIPNAETAYNDFLAGDVDFTGVPSTKMGSYQQDAPGQYVTSQTGDFLWYLIPPLWDKDYQSADVRKALSMAINRTTLSKLVGTATPATEYVQRGVDGFREGTCGTACNYDPAGAKSLLQQAGGFKGGPLKIYYSTDSATSQTYAQAIGNMFRQNLDIKVTYVGKTSSEINDLASDHKVDGVRIGGWGFDYPSIEDDLTPILACQADYNPEGYCNKKVDALLAEGNSQSDSQKAIGIYQQAEDLAMKDLPNIPLYETKSIYLYSKRIKPLNSKYTGISALYSTFTS
ncbi:peptide ABC transporter substrate-binding protein [Microlunatus endophyticus]|uniref:Peptide ABC transporter substrate-binding protein n=1 Tax=Microlunatus endophyticus TaxID=1716077 RepID=A0A917S2D6_9ACTN|nr:ABC transporter substrate-binding protein [Microlunatus endophyticus]GGL50449.1 peptide ABC transporter substrate-binding protein [Microlunatus endophyticus]